MVISEYVKPNTVEEAYELIQSDAHNLIIGGGAWMKLTVKKVNKLISLELLNLNQIVVQDNRIVIGAMVPLREIETHPELRSLYDGILSQACGNIMGLNVRNIATIGGSIMGRLAFSDLYPALLTMGATLNFYKNGSMSLDAFLMQQKREKDILMSVSLPRKKGKGFFKKVATTPLDFAILNIAVTKDKEGFRISLGSTPYMATLATSSVKDLPDHLTENQIQDVSKSVIEELKFSDNIRSSKEYRLELAKTYVVRGLRKVMSDVD